MRVIVLTSDKYLQAVRPFAHLFNKYWAPDQPVLVAGFSEPRFSLPPNFSFHSIGRFVDYPVHRWSDALLALMGQIDDEAFVLMLEDYWLIRPVDTRGVRILYDYALQFQNTLRPLFRRENLEAMGIQREPYWLATFECAICDGRLTMEIVDAKVIETLEQRVQGDEKLSYIRVSGHETPF